MAKLYPPYIEGTIPAFCVNGSTARLTVPFSMNKAVGMGDFSGIALKLKTVQTNEYIATMISDPAELISIKNTLKVSFEFQLNEYTKLKPGQYYKVQIAYCDTSPNRIIGYYSTIGVVKLTTRPQVRIADLESGLSSNIATNRLTYTGVYEQKEDNADVSEKVYEYCFNLYDYNSGSGSSTLVASSEWQLHNSSTDVINNESTDQYSFTYSLKPGHTYQVEYIIRTINGLEQSSGKYMVMEKVGIEPELYADFYYNINFDNGYIDLKLKPNNPQHDYANGAFVLSRASDEDDYTNWYELYRFTLRDHDVLTDWNFKDFTVEHGKKYLYSIQQYNSKGLYSKRLYAFDEFTGKKYAEADFEDAFLYDGKKQLKIRFNPKISSFKTDKLEQKVETIGSQYPFIFRNARVSYKEFPIAGLISYQSDQDQFFMTAEELGLNESFNFKERFALTKTPSIQWSSDELKPYTTTFESYNILAERLFKIQVLDWLNNGEPKLFRSPVEGNYLVRLMNVSLSPEDRLGRMLHNFQATAYEIDDCKYKTLNEYGIITVGEVDEIQYRLMTVDLSKKETWKYYYESAAAGDRIQEATAALQATQTDLNERYGEAVLQREEIIDRLAASYSDSRYQDLVNINTYIESLESQLQALEDEFDKLNSMTSYNKFNQYDIYDYIEFRDCMPGSTFWIWDMTTGSEFSITIGATGSYTVHLEGHLFSSVRAALDFPYMPNENELDENDIVLAFGLITYKYMAAVENTFEKVYDIDIEQVVAHQFFGGPVTAGTDGLDIINDKTYGINNIKQALVSLYYTNFTAKQIQTIRLSTAGSTRRYYDYTDQVMGEELSTDNFSPFILYQVYTSDLSFKYHYALYDYNADTYKLYETGVPDYSITVDGEKMILEFDHESELLSHLIQFFNDQTISSLVLGNAICLDCAYTVSTQTYNIENTDDELLELKNTYLGLIETYNSLPNTTVEEKRIRAQQYEGINAQWREYLNTLQEKLE